MEGMVTGGVGIFGCGGSNISPFGTPLELPRDEIYATLRAGYDFVRDVRPLLMICHPAAVRHQMRSHPQRPAGRQHRRAAIYRRGEADVCISGHIHESAGVDRIGPTQIFNAGPFKGRRLYSGTHD